MTARLTRRALLRGLSAGSLLPWWLGIGADAAAASQRSFPHGVASGDPDANSLIIWTRIAGAEAAAEVRWEFAEDPMFHAGLRTGVVTTDAGRDGSVKVLVSDLAPGRVWYYRFSSDGAYSMVGRTRTLPVGNVATYSLAVASCSNFPFGHFNGYDAIGRDESLDLVLHLGDYIYEYASDEWGGDPGRRLDRGHLPTHEIVSLADYRMRHAQYKSDPGSILMHAAHPLIAIWDDHESANNPWMGGAQNHQPASEGPWAERRSASLQAYYEWMPIRDAEDRAEYRRSFRIGDLASIIALETRHTGRAEQIAYTDHLDAQSSPEQTERFRADILGAADRTMLSSASEKFLEEALGTSLAEGQSWRVLANQIPMARIHVPALRAPAFDQVRSDAGHPAHAQLQGLTALGDRDLPIYTDTWDGYPWARERLYERCRGIGVEDLLVLTGDSHAFWLNALHDASGASMGVELGTTGISSPGDFVDFGPGLGAEIDRRLARHNPEVLWTDNGPRGYLRLTLTAESAWAEFIALSSVESTDYTTRVLATARIRRQDKGLRIERQIGEASPGQA